MYFPAKVCADFESVVSQCDFYFILFSALAIFNTTVETSPLLMIFHLQHLYLSIKFDAVINMKFVQNFELNLKTFGIFLKRFPIKTVIFLKLHP